MISVDLLLVSYDDLFDDLREQVHVDRLRQYFVDVVQPSLLDKFVFDVSGACEDERLWHSVNPIECSNARRCFVAVHERHANVCDHQAIDMLPLLEGVSHFIEAFKAIVRSVNHVW